MRRGLLVVAVGLTFLILMTWLGTLITSIIPHHITAQEQTAQSGPYQVTLRVNPNPPLTSQPATLSIQLLSSTSQQPITNAHITLQGEMVEMGMGTDTADTHSQANGTYTANLQFSMSGLWRIHVNISTPGTWPATADFEVTAQ